MWELKPGSAENRLGTYYNVPPLPTEPRDLPLPFIKARFINTLTMKNYVNIKLQHFRVK
jgi:hypothetical protein